MGATRRQVAPGDDGTAAPTADSLGRQFAAAFLSGGGVLVLNFVTGLVVARSLGPSGRGEIAALFTFVQLLCWFAGLGLGEALTYRVARRPEEAPRVLGTAIALVVVLGTAALLLSEVLLPHVLSAQRDGLLVVARLFALTAYANIALTLLTGVVGGLQDFAAVNLVRIVQPAIYVAGLVAALVVGGLDVGAVLVASGVSTAVAGGWLLVRTAGRVGLAAPSMAVLREALPYGIKVQGGTIAGMGTSRLDLVMMPAVLSAGAIGLYSVATNVSWILVGLLGAANDLVFAAASARGEVDGLQLVARTVRLVMVMALLVAVPLFVLAPWALSFVYGAEFGEAATALRILLPGVVLLQAAGIMSTGLQAVNRPFAGSVPYFAGLAVTAVGLTAFLGRYGIAAAAWTSTASYAVTFAVSLGALLRHGDFDWRTAFSPLRVRDDLAGVRAAIARRRAPAPPPASSAVSRPASQSA
jgi:O-antigen/teichoic acid export membrane protein